MRRNINYQRVKFTDGVNITAQALLLHVPSIMYWLTVRLLFVWSVSGQLAAPGSHADGGGRCGITSLSSCLYRGSWIYLSVGLSDSPPWRVEVCDREMERDGGWTGRVRADCLSVMNINGLQVSLPSSGSPLWKQAWSEDVGWRWAVLLPSLSTYSQTCIQNTHKHTQSYECVPGSILWWRLCFSVQPEQLRVRRSTQGNFIMLSEKMFWSKCFYSFCER